MYLNNLVGFSGQPDINLIILQHNERDTVEEGFSSLRL